MVKATAYIIMASETKKKVWKFHLNSERCRYKVERILSAWQDEPRPVSNVIKLFWM